MNIVTNADGYEVVDIAVVDSMTLLNTFRDKIYSMIKTEITGDAKNYYASFLEDAVNKAKEELEKKAKELGGDALFDVRVDSFIKDVKGDILIGAVAQCLVLKKGA